MTHEGISPEDAERLLIRPMEQQLRSIEGVKEMRAQASEGQASVTLEFDAGFDIDQALADVRDAGRPRQGRPARRHRRADRQRGQPRLFPVLVVTLSAICRSARCSRSRAICEERIEALPNVLGVEIAGEREELLEVVIDPLPGRELRPPARGAAARVVRATTGWSRPARSIPAQGRFAVKVPGVFETPADVLNLPIKVGRRQGGAASATSPSVRRTFKDPEGFARVNGRPALALEVSKRIGANIIDTVAAGARAWSRPSGSSWPANVEVGFLQDKSDDIESMLTDLQNNVLSAILLVMIVVVAALGLRSAGAGRARRAGLVPGRHAGAGALLGLTVNIVVLFGLILAVGMLVDGAIVVTELADRKMAEGLDRREAYRLAAKRMAWPITASTATTLAAFLPLLFWPGIVGEFMKFLPITLLATLTASLVMALIFVPVLGRPDRQGRGRRPAHDAGCSRRPSTATRPADAASPASTCASCGAAAAPAGPGADRRAPCSRSASMPPMAPSAAASSSSPRSSRRSRGCRSTPAAICRRCERTGWCARSRSAIQGMDGIETVYARSGVSFRNQDVDEDVIGILLLEFDDWRAAPAGQARSSPRSGRAPPSSPASSSRSRKDEAGPPVGKPIQVQLSAARRQRCSGRWWPRCAPISTSSTAWSTSPTRRPIPGIEWRMKIDREQAGRFGADIALVGSFVQLVTNGILIGNYRPDDADDEIDIRARFPDDERSLGQFDRLRVNTAPARCRSPISSSARPAPRVGTIARTDGRRQLTVAADVADGVLADDKVREIRAWLAAPGFRSGGRRSHSRARTRSRRNPQAFLSRAFVVALFLIAIILVTQFNSFYQSLLILSAIVFSTVGVLLGLLLTQQPFGIVMSGVGVIALAGIVVNNNIVLIDTYNELRKRGLAPFDAVLRTGAQRLRPVMLTTVTTILGLLPMVLKVNIDLVSREITSAARRPTGGRSSPRRSPAGSPSRPC